MRSDGFRFRSGRLCLNFVATLAGRHRGGEEQLTDPADLGAWLRASALLPAAPEVRPAELEQARELREAIYRLVHPATSNQPGKADIAQLNIWSGRCGLRLMLCDDARSAVQVAEQPVQACLADIAVDAIDLLSDPLLRQVRECERAQCSVLFLDTSRSQPRRWCDMARCGNQVKARRHRYRQRVGSAS
jgi:predicted RNA-binding Zn ribbon-like protein